MKIKYQCSNCGAKYQTSPMLGIAEGMWFLGVRVVGDAVYCEECTRTWAERNGEPFDKQYPNGAEMLKKWWNDSVIKLAKENNISSVQKYKRTITGDYLNDGEVLVE